VSALVKRAVGPVISCERFPEIVEAIGIFGTIMLLRIISSARQIVITQ
jgi:hypothetical protein